MKHNLLLSILVIFTTTVFGQQKLRFTYDTAGNQITRARVCNTCLKARLPVASDSLVAEAISLDDELHLPEATEFKLTAYPNPVSDMLSVDWSSVKGTEPIAIQVFSSDGRQLAHHDVRKGQSHQEINFGKYPIGLYIVSVRLQNGISKAVKTIKV